MPRLSDDALQKAGEIMLRYPVARSAMIPLLHLAQAEAGWISPEAMGDIASLIGMTPVEVFSVATFYEMFKLEPVGRFVIGICTNISCLLRGGDALLAHAEDRLGVRPGGTTPDGTISLEETECLAACGGAPCLQVNYRYFENVSPTGFDRIVDELRAGRLDGEVPPHGVLNRVELPAPQTEPTPVDSLALRAHH